MKGQTIQARHSGLFVSLTGLGVLRSLHRGIFFYFFFDKLESPLSHRGSVVTGLLRWDSLLSRNNKEKMMKRFHKFMRYLESHCMFNSLPTIYPRHHNGANLVEARVLSTRIKLLCEWAQRSKRRPSQIKTTGGADEEKLVVKKEFVQFVQKRIVKYVMRLCDFFASIRRAPFFSPLGIFFNSLLFKTL